MEYFAKNFIYNIFLSGSLLIIFLYHLFLFIFRSDKMYLLYFSIFTLIISVWTGISGDAFGGGYFALSSNFGNKLLLIRYLAVPIFCLLIADLFREEFSGKMLILSQVWGLLFFISVLLFSTRIATFITYCNIISLFFGVYCLLVIIQAIRRGKEYSITFAGSLLFLLLVVINDLLFSAAVIKTGYFLQPALYIFVLLHFFNFAKLNLDEISEMKTQIKKLKKREGSLVQKSRYKDKFIADISGELKLPLKKIISSTESILHGGKVFLEEELKKDMATILKIGRSLNYRLDTLADYHEIQGGNISLKREKVEVHNLINNILNLYNSYVADRNINFENKIKPQEYAINVDKGRIIQVVFYILDDICKFMNKGKIIFRAEKKEKKIEIRLETEVDNIFFKYHNKGFSGPKAEIDFDNFDFRQKITRELLKLHNGKLKIKKKGNRVLHLIIILPGERYVDFYEGDGEKQVSSNYISEIGKEKAISKPARTSIQQQKSILIIGSKDESFGLLNNTLFSKNYSIQRAEGRNRVAEMLNNNLVLVIFNVFSLDSSILNLCKKIRSRFSLFELPILIMTARNRPSDLTEGFEVGINDFIKKPFEISELKARVRTLITLKEQVEENVRREQDFLRAQIKPHFIYNTLDTIAYLCDEDPRRASDLILDFASYLRYSFDFESMDQLVPVKKELELVDFYLSVQKERFREKINIEYNVEEGLYFAIPPLMLQALVENAIKHGIAKNEGGGTVTISIEKRNNCFMIEVRDDGAGMSSREIAGIFAADKIDEGQGIGLININKRLKKLYGEEVKIKSSRGEGTAVEFRIPRQGEFKI